MKISKPGFLLYKCRRCEKVNDNLHVPDGLVLLMHLLHDAPLPQQWFGVPVSKTEICLCDDGNIGVADVIGVKYD